VTNSELNDAHGVTRPTRSNIPATYPRVNRGKCVPAFLGVPAPDEDQARWQRQNAPLISSAALCRRRWWARRDSESP